MSRQFKSRMNSDGQLEVFVQWLNPNGTVEHEAQCEVFELDTDLELIPEKDLDFRGDIHDNR